MRKVIVLSLLFIAGIAFGQDFTFRGLPWGSSIKDVITKEGNPTYSNTYGDESILTYKNVSIAGTTADLKYTFSKSGLIGAKYEILFPDTNSPQKLYQSITVNLKSLYGRPIEERYIPKGTLLGLTKDSWSYSWIFLRTHITYIYQIDIDDDFSYGSIEYKSPEMNPFGGL